MDAICVPMCFEVRLLVTTPHGIATCNPVKGRDVVFCNGAMGSVHRFLMVVGGMIFIVGIMARADSQATLMSGVRVPMPTFVYSGSSGAWRFSWGT